MNAVKAKDFHFAIVDDSEIIRDQLAKAIVTLCASEGFSYQLFQVNRGGQLTEVVQADLKLRVQAQSHEKPINNYYIYTAPSYKLALRVLDLPILEQLTLLCDLSIPADTQVGLLGLLDAIVKRKLPVNLIFISSDFQNRVSIEPLLKKGKAYFIEKGTSLWDALPEALVNRASRFQYHTIEPEDYTSRPRSTTPLSYLEELTRATTAAAEKSGTGPLPNIVPIPGPGTGPLTASLAAEFNRTHSTNTLQNSAPKTEEPLVEAAVADNPAVEEDKPTTPGVPKESLMETVSNTVRELPGKAADLTSSGAEKLREIPQMLKKTSFLRRVKEENEEPE